MELYITLAMLILGLGFLLLEVFIIPGTTIIGIIGTVLMATGVYYVYTNYGTSYGHLALGITIIITIIAIIGGLRGGVWNKIAISDAINSKVALVEDNTFKIGDEGMTISNLRPAGTVKINGVKTEAHSIGDFIERNSPIKVIKTEKNKIFVELKK